MNHPPLWKHGAARGRRGPERFDTYGHAVSDCSDDRPQDRFRPYGTLAETVDVTVFLHRTTGDMMDERWYRTSRAPQHLDPEAARQRMIAC